ncbi:hypothetical protein [Methanogenium cariaci]|uniref:hypothetical protein n=1 Tax=Methanogenium cariaci TaxID=2197 RepID=UPI000780AB6C|nr:hypothetical protein [Methanogenium cariaci]
MNIHSKRLWAGLAGGALCLVAFVIAPVSAGMGMGAGNGCAAGGSGMGDQIRDRTCDPICDQIRDQNRDQTCDPGCDQPMENRLAVLEEQGVDVTDVRTAFASGDRETIRGHAGRAAWRVRAGKSFELLSGWVGPSSGGPDSAFPVALSPE